MELESILNSQNNLEKENKVGRFTFPNFKTYKIIKLLEGNNVCVNLHDLKFGNGFLDVTPKAQVTKEKIDKLEFIKISNFCTLKDTIKRMKSPPTQWEKLFANRVSNKGLISRIHIELLKLNN